MKYNGLVIMIILVVFLLTSCSNEDISDDNSNRDSDYTEGEEKQMDYLTVEEFWEKTGLNKDDYSELDIQQFIYDYHINEESIKELNIVGLLEIYDGKKDIRNFEYLFNDDYVKRTGDYTSDIVRVAAVYNVDTSVQSLMYDCSEKNKYYSNAGYIFYNISKVEYYSYSDDEYNKLFKTMDDIDFFKWESFIGEENSADGLYFEMVIEYSDGSYYKVKFIDEIGDVDINDYNTLLTVLFGQV